MEWEFGSFRKNTIDIYKKIHYFKRKSLICQIRQPYEKHFLFKRCNSLREEEMIKSFIS